MLKFSPFTIALVLASLVFTAGSWFGVIPQLKEWGRAQAQHDQLLAQPLAKVSNTHKDTVTAEATKQIVEALLPANDNQYDLSVQIEALSKQVGLTLSNLVVTSTPPPAVAPKTTATKVADPTTGVLRTVSVNVSGKGTYLQVQSFLKQLTALDRFIQLNQVSLASAASSDTSKTTDTASTTSVTSSDQVILQVSGVAYYLPSTK